MRHRPCLWFSSVFLALLLVVWFLPPWEAATSDLQKPTKESELAVEEALDISNPFRRVLRWHFGVDLSTGGWMIARDPRFLTTTVTTHDWMRIYNSHLGTSLPQAYWDAQHHQLGVILSINDDGTRWTYERYRFDEAKCDWEKMSIEDVKNPLAQGIHLELQSRMAENDIEMCVRASDDNQESLNNIATYIVFPANRLLYHKQNVASPACLLVPLSRLETTKGGPVPVEVIVVNRTTGEQVRHRSVIHIY